VRYFRLKNVIFKERTLSESKNQCFRDSKHIFKSKIASVLHEKNTFEHLNADFVRIKIFTMASGVFDLFLSLKLHFRTKSLSKFKSLWLGDSKHIFESKILRHYILRLFLGPLFIWPKV
jgi:hypothetical protein